MGRGARPAGLGRTGLVVVAVVALAALGVALWALLDDTGDRPGGRESRASRRLAKRVHVSRANSARPRPRAVWRRSALVSGLSSGAYRRARRASRSLGRRPKTSRRSRCGRCAPGQCRGARATYAGPRTAALRPSTDCYLTARSNAWCAGACARTSAAPDRRSTTVVGDRCVRPAAPLGIPPRTAPTG